MPVVNRVVITHDQLVAISNRLHENLNKTISQGTLEWALFRSVSDELGVDLFAMRLDECQCGNKKSPEAKMCTVCEEADEMYWWYRGE
jgi:hypothetical protein